MKKLVPTIEVSAKATVTPASGATVDFSSNKAIFTVVVEDGSSKIYTASISGRAFVVSYDFEEWDPVHINRCWGMRKPLLLQQDGVQVIMA